MLAQLFELARERPELRLERADPRVEIAERWRARIGARRGLRRFLLKHRAGLSPHERFERSHAHLEVAELLLEPVDPVRDRIAALLGVGRGSAEAQGQKYK